MNSKKIDNVTITDTKKINIGLDVGSTTLKVVVTDSSYHIIYKEYCRHHADILGTLNGVLTKMQDQLGNLSAKLTITGSAGMGLSERFNMDFCQEVVASCEVIYKHYPQVTSFVDIGGEDSKMIFFEEGKTPDIRMNGSCAGGTGSFIDQMCALLNIEMDELNALAEKSDTIYPIASRCGVFSKTDVQNLLARNVSKADIAASVLHAVSMQVITSLARGYDLTAKVFLCGGPFTFIPLLSEAFVKVAKLQRDDVIIPESSEVVPAWGASILAHRNSDSKPVSEYIDIFNQKISRSNKSDSKFLKPLFKDGKEQEQWRKSKEKYRIRRISIKDLTSPNCFIGIDSGSTTTKIVATDEEGRVFFEHYAKNEGLSLNAVAVGLKKLLEKTKEANLEMKVLGSCVTGYGEDLIKKAFQMDFGMVETIAHYMGAYHFDEEISFILDIGGQDMKAIFIENGIIKRLEINEACSSGCGSFIETFANSLNYSVPDFSQIALESQRPCDLGTRCTVFMNSKVKQSQREGATVADISAGLGYSVVGNCLTKVLKLKDYKELGDHIMVQGGTFRNISVLRALEIEIGKEVMVTDAPEMMGAYGAALYAREKFPGKETLPVNLTELAQPREYITSKSVCRGCENNCTVSHFKFETGERFYAGNKCEKIFTNSGSSVIKGINLHTEKYELLFDRPIVKDDQALTLGIPRVLGLYENYPFWHKLFTECGIKVVLSDRSTMKMYESGISTVMADNICFPAKLTHGHIYNLIDKKVDRIFMPYIVYESKDDTQTNNSYNCPIVTGYSDVIKSAIDPEKNFQIPVDEPTFTFANKRLMKRASKKYIHTLLPGMSNAQFEKAFNGAVKAQEDFEAELNGRAKEILENAENENRLVIMLAGRPYHIDPLIQHKIADMVTDFGVDVITEDIVRDLQVDTNKVQSVMQWEYTNRVFKAALWAANDAPKNVNYVQITSFGCGPDSFILDEVTDILKRSGKNTTIIKVDDINNIGSTRLRIRSLVESIKFKSSSKISKKEIPVHTIPFTKKERHRTILAPWFGDFYSPFIPPAFELMGYKIENLPPSNYESVNYGLRYSNNEICYPATLVVGDLMKALDNGKYNRHEVALGVTQTGGQCRATNYVALIKKAMLAAGLEDIPVVTVSTTKNLNVQPGFKIQWARYIKIIAAAVIYADCLSQFYYSTAPRETEKGGAKRLQQQYLELGVEAMRRNDTNRFYELVEMAANEFLAINNRKEIQRIGIVGEIYVKYNSFGHKNVVNWLVSQGVEPVIPPITEFFIKTFVNKEERVQGDVMKRQIPKFIMDIGQDIVYKMIRNMESKIKHYPYYTPISHIDEDAKLASQIVNLNAQFGEGWGIPAEFAAFAQNGINNVVSLQPFGCIANHVISKGIEKRTRELYPNLNLLFLDFDSGMSEANIYNRLHFMINQ